VWVDGGTGQRNIAAYRGSHPVEPGQIDPKSFYAHHALHLDGWAGAAAMRAAAAMHERGGLVFMDLGSPKPDLEKLLRHVDFLNCPERLIHRLFDTRDLVEGARRLIAMGPKEVSVTSGENGARYVTENRALHQPAFQVEALDTNGAGDVFAGAMIFATLQGWKPERRLRFACAASALKCMGLGNRDSLPSLEEIETFISNR
jgi:sugar/nucleoside kinase (ribokinase family)